jgi:hypothetical protein
MNDFAVLNAPDDMIELVAENSLARYFRIGQKVTVSERASGGWLCGSCSGAKRYWTKEHTDCCAHIERVARYVTEHPTKAVA